MVDSEYTLVASSANTAELPFAVTPLQDALPVNTHIDSWIDFEVKDFEGPDDALDEYRERRTILFLKSPRDTNLETLQEEVLTNLGAQGILMGDAPASSVAQTIGRRMWDTTEAPIPPKRVVVESFIQMEYDNRLRRPQILIAAEPNIADSPSWHAQVLVVFGTENDKMRERIQQVTYDPTNQMLGTLEQDISQGFRNAEPRIMLN